jgi:hypothetical protein
LDVRIHLSRTPPPEWAQFFQQGIGVILPMSMHLPELRGAEVLLRPPDNELQAYVLKVDERINSANTHYEQLVLPKLRAQEEQQKKAAEETERRVAAAREAAKKL